MSSTDNMAVRKRTMVAAVFIIALLAVFWLFQHNPFATRERRERDFATKVPVSVALVAKGELRDSIAVIGLIDAWRDVDILSETSGVVRSVMSEVGQKKAAGQTLIKVDDEVAASLLRKANVNRALAMRDYERYGNLQREGAVALSSYEAMKLKLEDAEADLVAAKRRFDDTSVKAPFTGIVTSRLVEIGELVQPGMKVANMVDLTKVRIKSSVPEKQVGLITAGMAVQVTTDIWPGRTFLATVASVSAKSTRGHTYQVESVMDNPGATPFRAGMFARTLFVGREARQAVLIPRQALVGSIRNPEVFIVTRGVARRVRLAVGAESGNRLEVLSGLQAGDLVVISGQNELDNGAPVTVNRQEPAR